MFCRNCGYELKKNNKFCPKCGLKVESKTEDSKEKIEDAEVVKEKTIYCRNCGKKISEDSKNCPECGFLLKNNNEVVADDNSVENFFIYAVSFLIPIFGIFFWAITRNQNATRAKNALIAALVNICIFVLIIIFIFVFVITYAISSTGVGY